MTDSNGPPRIYTWGYAGRHPADLRALAERLNAYVADIRYMPFGRDPRWSQDPLKAALGWRYQWIRALGNKNYKGTTIQIVDLQQGFEKIGGLLATGRSVILVCVCRDLASCHRKVVSDAIQADGTTTVEHLGVKPAAQTASLFGDGQ